MLRNHPAIRRLFHCDDAELVRRVLRGGRDEFGVLVRRHYWTVYARAYARLGGRAEAAAVAQAAFAETYRLLDTLGAEEAFEERLWAVARERCRHLPGNGAAVGNGDASENGRRIRRAFLELDAQTRLAFMLRYGAGRAVGAVAACCGMPLQEAEERLRVAEAHFGEERFKDVIAAVGPPVDVEDVTRVATAERVHWRMPEPVARRRRGVAAIAVALIAAVGLGLWFVPSDAMPERKPVSPPVEAPRPASVETASAPVPAPEAAPVEGGSFEGRVVDAATGEPLREFEVAHPADKDARGNPQFMRMADADGRFALSGLAAGTAEIRVRAAGYVEAVCRAEVAEAPVSADVPLERARTVDGVVRDLSGQPVAGVMIFVEEVQFPFPDGQEAVRSDAQGTFRVEGLPPDGVTLCAYHPDYAIASVESEGTGGVEFSLARGGRIEGTVRAASEPLVNAEVRVVADEDETGVFGFTDADGHYALDAVPIGPVRLSVNWTETRKANRDVAVEAGGTAWVDIDFAPATTRVEGRVTQNGKVVQYAEVDTLVTSAAGDTYRALVKADSDGWYRTEPLAAGQARLLVMAITADSRMRRKAVDVTVPEDGVARHDVDFSERATLVGRLQGLKPGEHARVYALWSGLERMPETRGQLEALTKSAVARQFLRENGTFRMESMEPGRYILFAMALRDETPEDFDVARSATIEVELRGKGDKPVTVDLK